MSETINSSSPVEPFRARTQKLCAQSMRPLLIRVNLTVSNRNFFRQDTCVALQALSKYSEKTAGAKLDLRVSVSSEKDVNWKRKYHIDRGNALILRQEDVRLLSR